MWDDTDEIRMEARERRYKEKTIGELPDDLEEARRRIEVIRNQLINLGYDMRLLEES